MTGAISSSSDAVAQRKGNSKGNHKQQWRKDESRSPFIYYLQSQE
jgi:hypothetical protein